MSGELGCGIIISSTFVGTIILNYALKLAAQKTICKLKMFNLERKLKNSLYDLNYSLFKDTIYEITVLDSKYETSFLNHIKRKYFINEGVMTDKEIFLTKYDRNYNFKEYIHDEIERSVSRLYGN